MASPRLTQAEVQLLTLKAFEDARLNKEFQARAGLQPKIVELTETKSMKTSLTSREAGDILSQNDNAKKINDERQDAISKLRTHYVGSAAIDSKGLNGVDDKKDLAKQLIVLALDGIYNEKNRSTNQAIMQKLTNRTPGFFESGIFGDLPEQQRMGKDLIGTLNEKINKNDLALNPIAALTSTMYGITAKAAKVSNQTGSAYTAMFVGHKQIQKEHEKITEEVRRINVNPPSVPVTPIKPTIGASTPASNTAASNAAAGSVSLIAAKINAANNITDNKQRRDTLSNIALSVALPPEPVIDDKHAVANPAVPQARTALDTLKGKIIEIGKDEKNFQGMDDVTKELFTNFVDKLGNYTDVKDLENRIMYLRETFNNKATNGEIPNNNLAVSLNDILPTNKQNPDVVPPPPPLSMSNS